LNSGVSFSDGWELMTSVDKSKTGSLPIVIVGAGLAGTTAAAVLGQQGRRVTLVDPRSPFPPVFKAEKIEPGPAQLLRKFGLLKHLPSNAGRIREIQGYFNGRLFSLKHTEQYGIYYPDLVNALRAHLPATVEFKLGRVEEITPGAERQLVRLADGEQITARLVVLACPVSSKILASLGLRKVVIQKDQSLALGFTITRADGQPFSFDAVTYCATNPDSAVDYLTLFRIGATMRANLFVFRASGDPWVREFIREPAENLKRSLPKLCKSIGEFRVVGSVETGSVDLYRMQGDPVPGVVMIGDASQSVCPATGMGLTKALTDVDVLCSECIPGWDETLGVGADKTVHFSKHPQKQASDRKALQNAMYRRRACTDRSWRWKIHRLRLHLEMQFKKTNAVSLLRLPEPAAAASPDSELRSAS
jgi:2-polyprenyl-6-methoxyphenol hydroxylase-like FAD-dependent oxidoreductase